MFQRFYASTYGRFNTADPGPARAQEPATWNRYAYVAGDPINRSDPRGLCIFDESLGLGLDGYDEAYAKEFGYGWVGEGSCQQYMTNGCWLAQYSTCQGGGGGNDPAAAEPDGGGGGSTQGGATDPLINIKNWTSTSAQAVGVQNSLRWIQSQITQYSDCDKWLSGNGAVIDTILGQSSASPTDLVGVGNFSDPLTNAVAGTTGTNLAVGSAFLTVNLNGAYFNSGASVGAGVSGINGGSDQAKLFILLHELGHLTGAQDFVDGDNIGYYQRRNNALLMSHCGDFIKSVGN